MERATYVGLNRIAVGRQGRGEHADSRLDGLAEGAALPRMGVVRNPTSHRNRGFKPEALDSPNVLTSIPRTRAELSEALAHFAEQRIELLVIDGGDGTVREVLTCGASIFGSHWPRLLLLPKGKTNALAEDLGLPHEWSFAEALRAVCHAQVEKRRPMVIERPDRDDWQVTGFIMGAGVFNAAIDAGQVAHRWGAFQAFAIAIAVIFGIVQALFGMGKCPWRTVSPMRVLATKDRQDVERSAYGKRDHRFASVFSTLNRFPLGIRPFSRTGQGIKYLVIDAPLRRVMAMMPLILRGAESPLMRRLGIHRGSADEITLQLGGKFILDGEAFPPGSYRLRLGPELHFLVP